MAPITFVMKNAKLSRAEMYFFISTNVCITDSILVAPLQTRWQRLRVGCPVFNAGGFEYSRDMMTTTRQPRCNLGGYVRPSFPLCKTSLRTSGSLGAVHEALRRVCR